MSYFKTLAVSTTAHLTKYTAMKYTAIQCIYICSALRRWLVLSQMEHLREPLGGSDGRKSARDTRETKPAKINVLFLWKAAQRAPPLPLRS